MTQPLFFAWVRKDKYVLKKAETRLLFRGLKSVMTWSRLLKHDMFRMLCVCAYHILMSNMEVNTQDHEEHAVPHTWAWSWGQLGWGWLCFRKGSGTNVLHCPRSIELLEQRYCSQIICHTYTCTTPRGRWPYTPSSTFVPPWAPHRQGKILSWCHLGIKYTRTIYNKGCNDVCSFFLFRQTCAIFTAIKNCLRIPLLLSEFLCRIVLVIHREFLNCRFYCTI